MSDAEIGSAWLKTKKEYRAIQDEIAALKSELMRFGTELIGTGEIFKDTPDMAWNQDMDGLAKDAVKAGTLAKRYQDLLTEEVDKKSELDNFEKNG